MQLQTNPLLVPSASLSYTLEGSRPYIDAIPHIYHQSFERIPFSHSVQLAPLNTLCLTLISTAKEEQLAQCEVFICPTVKRGSTAVVFFDYFSLWFPVLPIRWKLPFIGSFKFINKSLSLITRFSLFTSVKIRKLSTQIPSSPITFPLSLVEESSSNRS